MWKMQPSYTASRNMKWSSPSRTENSLVWNPRLEAMLPGPKGASPLSRRFQSHTDPSPLLNFICSLCKTVGSLSTLNILKFVHLFFSFTHCAGHLVDLLNLGIYDLQFGKTLRTNLITVPFQFSVFLSLVIQM